MSHVNLCLLLFFGLSARRQSDLLQRTMGFPFTATADMPLSKAAELLFKQCNWADSGPSVCSGSLIWANKGFKGAAACELLLLWTCLHPAGLKQGSQR